MEKDFFDVFPHLKVKKELEEGTLVEVPVGFSFPLREIGFVCRQKDVDMDLIMPFFWEDKGIK